MSDKPIYITQFDKDRLVALILDSMGTSYRRSEYLSKLREELARARVMPSTEIPANVITMNSRVVLVDVDTGEKMNLTLVFPENADIEKGKISILAPVGTGMLGYELGDVFEWKVPDGVRKLQVKEILYQPESAGDYDL